MGEKFLQFLPPGSKLGRVIRQVSATATPKSRKPRKTPEEAEGKAGTTRGALLRPARQPKAVKAPVVITELFPSGIKPGTHHKARRKQTPEQRRVMLANLQKGREVLAAKRK